MGAFFVYRVRKPAGNEMNQAVQVRQADPTRKGATMIVGYLSGSRLTVAKRRLATIYTEAAAQGAIAAFRAAHPNTRYTFKIVRHQIGMAA